MRVYWHNLELNLKPETKAEHAAIVQLGQFFSGVGFPDKDDGKLPLELERGRPYREVDDSRPSASTLGAENPSVATCDD